jgi:hypothetical protein
MTDQFLELKYEYYLEKEKEEIKPVGKYYLGVA